MPESAGLNNPSPRELNLDSRIDEEESRKRGMEIANNNLV